VVLAVHGGGWRGGGRGDYGRSLAPLVRRGVAVVAADYTLSRPGAPSWPANLDDLAAARDWLHANAATYGLDRDRLAVMGSSAGGHLALLLAGLPAVGARVRGVVDFYGPTDLSALHAGGTSASRSVELMLGASPAVRPAEAAAASPLAAVRRGMPPVLIVHGDDDPLVPPEQSHALARALAAANVPHTLLDVPGARHGFGLQVGTRDLLPNVLGFLDGLWAEK
jgi:acetyl esterase/lipase